MATPNLSPQNYFSTSLSAPMTSADTTVYLNLLPTASEGYLEVDEGTSNKELFYFTSKGSNFVTLPSVGAGRGVGGTAAVAHSSGAVVKMKQNAEWWKALQDGSALASVPTKVVTSPYKFSAYRSAAFSLPGASATTRIQFDTKAFDTGTNFDVTTNIGRFTAPVAGFYLVGANIGFNGAVNGVVNVQLFKNGSSIWNFGQINTASNANLSGSTLVSLAANDYLEIDCFNAGTTANLIIGAGSTDFWGTLVGV